MKNDTQSRRKILVTGDGSFGLTMQEIGTMITQEVAPIIFLINNSGYTVERIIHGARQPYNDINTLDYSKILPLFSHTDPEVCFHRCGTPAEVEATLNNLPTGRPSRPIFIEIIMDKMDVPWRLSAVMALRGPSAVTTLREEGFSGWKDGSIPVEWADAETILREKEKMYAPY